MHRNAESDFVSQNPPLRRFFANPVLNKNSAMSHKASTRSTPARNHRRTTEDDGGDGLKCTGKSCKSYAAVCIADCVAVCCCPCALVSILAFAFLKVPWTVGKRILKHEKNKKKKSKCEETNCKDCPVELDEISGKEGVEQEVLGFGFSGVRDESFESDFDRFEEEELFLELYQEVYLGFGRVSSAGIPSFL